MTNKIIYLDNAATSYPKPKGVDKAVFDAINNLKGNPLRGNYNSSISSSKLIEETRGSVAKLINADEPKNIIFTSNATESLNIAINGIKYKKGDEVITSDMEHNSVRRPLNYFQKKIGIKIIKLNTDLEKGISISELKKKITKKTKLIVITHASNVTGVLNNINEIGKVAKEKNIPFLVDDSQTLGSVEIDVKKSNISMLAAPGHKGLLAPSGTGILYVKEGLKLLPFKYGGTGIYSEDELMPEEAPYRFEAGTLNFHGISGLSESLKFILKEGVKKIGSKEVKLSEELYQELKKIKGIKIYSPKNSKNRVGTISFNHKDFDSTDLSTILDTNFFIATRSGLHCAPDAHEKLGTINTGGTLRVSVGYFNTKSDINFFIKSLKSVIE